MKLLYVLFFVGLLLLISGCSNRGVDNNLNATSNLDILNSASKFCEDNGGIIETSTVNDSQVKYCMLNGKKCEEFALMKHKCSQITLCDQAKNWDVVSCTMNYAPVCGNDGNTYGNGCTACAARVKMYTNGVCTEHFCTKSEHENNVCTLEYAPVCGNDNVTYGNKCSACASGVKSWKIGECK